MKLFILSPEAEQDLDDIKEHLLKESGIRVARYVLREIREALRFISRNPGAGHSRADLTDARVKFWSVFSYLIVYDPEPRPLWIVRIMHGRRDIPTALE